MPRFIKMWLFSALISFTALGMWKGIEWYYTRDIEDVAPIVISAEDLAKSYEDITTNSSAIYDGNYVLLTGEVTNIGDAGGYYTVNLKGALFYNIDLSVYDLDEIAKLNDINTGDIITINGKVIGLNYVYISITNITIE